MVIWVAICAIKPEAREDAQCTDAEEDRRYTEGRGDTRAVGSCRTTAVVCTAAVAA